MTFAKRFNREGFGSRSRGAVPHDSACLQHKASTSGAPSVHRGVQAVLSEFEHCVLALSVSLIAITSQSACAFDRMDLRSYQPVRPTLFPAMRSVLPDFGFAVNHVDAMDFFYVEFGRAYLAAATITSGEQMNGDRKWVIDSYLALTRAARVAQDLYSLLGSHVLASAPGSPELAPLQPHLRELLTYALSGKAELESDRFASLASNVGQRFEKRRTINAEAILSYGGSNEAIVVRDASRHGLGLSPSPKCEVGTAVAVNFAFGRSLIGSVVWKTPGEAGIQLLEPLAPNDPLLVGQ
jgi:hypothetical protein